MKTEKELLKENLEEIDLSVENFSINGIQVSKKLIRKVKSILRKIKIQPKVLTDTSYYLSGCFMLIFENKPRCVKIEIEIREKECKSRLIFTPKNKKSHIDFYNFELDKLFTSVEDTVEYINAITKYNFLI